MSVGALVGTGFCVRDTSARSGTCVVHSSGVGKNAVRLPYVP